MIYTASTGTTREDNMRKTRTARFPIRKQDTGFRLGRQLVLLSFLLFLQPLFPWFSVSANDSGYLSFKVKDEVLLREMMSGQSMLLPEFEVYNTAGFRVYHSTGLPRDFQAEVEASLTRDTQEQGHFSDIAPTLTTAEGAPVRDKLFSDVDHVFVEYWAEWCSACLQQMKQVEQIIQNHPESRILWLKVEKDPTKLKSMQIHMEKSGTSTPSAK
jgi:thiol-disulfide isomerase/thioredoxin